MGTRQHIGTHPLTEHTCDYAGCWCREEWPRERVRSDNTNLTPRSTRSTPRTRAVNRCADALERIADALGPKKQPPEPLGIPRKSDWDGRRMHDLLDATARYNAAGIEPPPEWYIELAELRSERER